MRFSILLLGTVLSLVCAQAPTPPTILPRQETSTSPSTTIYGTPGVPGVPGTPGTAGTPGYHGTTTATVGASVASDSSIITSTSSSKSGSTTAAAATTTKKKNGGVRGVTLPLGGVVVGLAIGVGAVF